MANKITIDLKRVEMLAGRGLTQAEIATSLGISERTLAYRKRDFADFAAAIKKGKADAAEVVANSLFTLCKKGNLGALIWYEKTRRGLSDKLDLNVNDVDAEIERELARLAASRKAGDAEKAAG